MRLVMMFIIFLGLCLLSIDKAKGTDVEEVDEAKPLYPFGDMLGRETSVEKIRESTFRATTPVKSTPKTIRRSGPRVGMTGVTGEFADRLKEDHDAEPLFSQFGWMFEQELPAGEEEGISVIFQEFFLIGGLDQNLAVPGFTFIMGLRLKPGIELGAGPNILLDPSELGEDEPEAKSFIKTAFVLGLGLSLPAGRFNFPINIAISPASTGLRTTIITGVSW